MDLFVIQKCSVSTYYIFVFLVKCPQHDLMVTRVRHCCFPDWMTFLSTIPRRKDMSIENVLKTYNCMNVISSPRTTISSCSTLGLFSFLL